MSTPKPEGKWPPRVWMHPEAAKALSESKNSVSVTLVKLYKWDIQYISGEENQALVKEAVAKAHADAWLKAEKYILERLGEKAQEARKA